MKTNLQKTKLWKVWIAILMVFCAFGTANAAVTYPPCTTSSALNVAVVVEDGDTKAGSGHGGEGGTNFTRVNNQYLTFGSNSRQGIGGRGGTVGQDNPWNINRWNYLVLRIRKADPSSDISNLTIGVYVDDSRRKAGDERLYSNWTSDGVNPLPELTTDWQWVVIKTDIKQDTDEKAWMRYYFTNAMGIHLADMYIAQNIPIYGNGAIPTRHTANNTSAQPAAPHAVGSEIDWRMFDIGNVGCAYQNGNSAGGEFRGITNFFQQDSGNDNTQMGWARAGNWLGYTFEVTEAGTYSIITGGNRRGNDA